MATILLSAAGAAAGASVGGSAFGLTSAVIGRAVGATIGRLIDAKILGAGSPAIETGRVDRFRLTGASEGGPIAQVHGRIRVPGHVVWASQFMETSTTTGGGGKGAPSQPKTTTFSYSVSMAIALCEGEITRVGRIWADGIEVSKSDLNLRVYTGSEAQLPDPKIEAIEGAGLAPAFRGTAYVVFEDLPLGRFGNRIPQFTFEVMRTGQGDPADQIRAVAMIPGTGEYALATTPVHFAEAPGKNRSANVNTPTGETDFQTSLDALREELPKCASTSLIVSWFGNDLRCGSCEIRPKVEQTALDGVGMPWRVSGVTRTNADTIPSVDDRPIYGGTPSDASVIEAIQAMNDAGQGVMFYPFILMDQIDGNTLTDPWSGAVGQPTLPWRGRITTSMAPGQTGSPDGSVGAQNEVEAFFGTAAPNDFVIDGNDVLYTGPEEFSYRRFILHYAALCAAAGGVEAFCIGSEMRGVTQIRGASNSFPAVQELVALAADVRAILGSDTKIGYAADWTEYFGFQPQDGSSDVFFHLDPLWADEDIDFVGIDNYMPLSDWRDGVDHADTSWGAVHNTEYLKSNVMGGEGFDWYYKTPEAEALQIRTPITDGAYGEPWIYRYKDLKSWWENLHFERSNGVRSTTSTAWVPGSKPFWFTEVGCAAIDKGTNQPNKFLDPKSSESAVPKYSNGARDDLVQMQYLRALSEFWADEAQNPTATAFEGRMVALDRMYVWAWDARPYPFFPGNQALWSDGDNYARGHWLSGRASTRSLASVVTELCEKSGVSDVDVSELYGLVRGYRLEGGEDARRALQPLLLANGVDVAERDGVLVFRNRGSAAQLSLNEEDFAENDGNALIAQMREPVVEVPAKVRLSYLEADGSYETRSDESVFPDIAIESVSTSDIPLVMTQSEGRRTAERWLSEARIARETVQFSLPLSSPVCAGDVVELDLRDGRGLYRVDRIEEADVRNVVGVRVERSVYDTTPTPEPVVPIPPVEVPVPVWPVLLDLPLLLGNEDETAPWVGATAQPWTGDVAVYGENGAGWGFEGSLSEPAIIGTTQNALELAEPAIWDRGAALIVKLTRGTLSSQSEAGILSGGNVAAIGNGPGSDWEVFQFKDAVLVGEDTWALSMRLRGQRGTEGAMQASWPAGSTFVLLNNALQQIQISASQRGLPRHYRIGPAAKPVDHASYQEMTHTAEGIGLRPFRPVHLRAVRDASGDLAVSWVRQTRVDGDLWGGVDVPLGEATEAYLVRVRALGTVRREETVVTQNWSYGAAEQSADGVTGGFTVEVAQISDRFGPGSFGKVEIND